MWVMHETMQAMTHRVESLKPLKEQYSSHPVDLFPIESSERVLKPNHWLKCLTNMYFLLSPPHFVTLYKVVDNCKVEAEQFMLFLSFPHTKTWKECHILVLAILHLIGGRTTSWCSISCKSFGICLNQLCTQKLNVWFFCAKYGIKKLYIFKPCHLFSSGFRSRLENHIIVYQVLCLGMLSNWKENLHPILKSFPASITDFFVLDCPASFFPPINSDHIPTAWCSDYHISLHGCII